MSFRLKAATLAAFTLSAIAAVMATDASQAVSASASNEKLPVTISAPQDGRVAPRAPAQSGMADAPPTDTSLTALVDSHATPDELSEEMRCLAGAVYFEAKSESLAGQLAVARVIINRMRSGRFADTLCGVVYQPNQFSFVRGGSMPPIRTESTDWREAVAIAQIAQKDAWNSEAEGALFFHARRVSPGWGKPRLAAIDNHIFYR